MHDRGGRGNFSLCIQVVVVLSHLFNVYCIRGGV